MPVGTECDQPASPGGGEALYSFVRDVWVCSACDNDARKRKPADWDWGKATCSCGKASCFGVARRNQKRACDPPAMLHSPVGDRHRSERVTDKDDVIVCVANSGIQRRYPIVANWRVPVALFHPTELCVLPFPLCLPMFRARAVEAGNDQDFGARQKRLSRHTRL